MHGTTPLSLPCVASLPKFAQGKHGGGRLAAAAPIVPCGTRLGLQLEGRLCCLRVWPNFLAPAVTLSLSLQTMSPRVMSDS
jgi:hypothetical protein